MSITIESVGQIVVVDQSRPGPIGPPGSVLPPAIIAGVAPAVGLPATFSCVLITVPSAYAVLWDGVSDQPGGRVLINTTSLTANLTPSAAGTWRARLYSDPIEGTFLYESPAWIASNQTPSSQTYAAEDYFLEDYAA